MNEMPIMSTYSYLEVNLIKGNGVFLYDDNQNEYLDFTSGIGVNSIGYNNPKWVEAITNQASKLAHISNIFLNESTLNLAKKLTDISKMEKVFFANSGAEANEGAIKLARKYSFEKYGQKRNKILTLKQSFHGRTLATLTATGQDKFHNYFFPFVEGFDYFKANDIDDFYDKLDDSVCGVMLESIQGEGGVNPLDYEFVNKMQAACSQKDILLIFDEVQCGIGRCGKVFGFEHFDVKPDIVSFAKGLGGGLPIGGFLCNKKLSNVLNPGDHGTTFGGNPVVCAGAEVVVHTICNEEKLEQISANGNYIMDLLKSSKHEKIKEVRGKGLMIGIEVDCEASDVQQKSMENGLLVLTAGKNVVRLLPPLVINKEEIEKGIEILLKSI